MLSSLLIGTSSAQSLSLNYESLSFLEQPLATHIGDTTVVLSGLLDLPIIIDLNGDTPSDVAIDKSVQLSVETQLANNWTLGAGYFAEYNSNLENNKFTDNAALYLSGIWGIFAVGNVAQTTREQTRRRRAAGNARLAFDDHTLIKTEDDNMGFSYIGRFGPTKTAFSIDDDGSFNLGFIFQRPLGNKDYRFSMRYSDNKFYSIADQTYNTQGISLVGDLTYGSSLFDLSIGTQNIDISNIKVNRNYVSLGAQHKFSVFTASIEGHYGTIDSQKEQSAALGMRYDIARGMSLNLGLNYQSADIAIGNIQLLDTNDTTATLSLRYQY